MDENNQERAIRQLESLHNFIEWLHRKGFVESYEDAMNLVADSMFAVAGEDNYLKLPLPHGAVKAILDEALCRLRVEVERETATDPPTDRELEALKWMTIGLSNAEIAEKMGIRSYTVTSHLYNLYQKIHAKSDREAIFYAYKNRLVDLFDGPPTAAA
jgi:DNA-binding CsgD family transcriptional regulator